MAILGDSAPNASGREPVVESVVAKQAREASACSVELTRSKYLARRFWPVLVDLGLDRVLGDWIMATDKGLEFRALSHKEADSLILALEGHVVARSNVVCPGSLQLSFFDD